VPDFFGLIGRVDDLALIGFLYWRYRRLFRKSLDTERLFGENKEAESKKGGRKERFEAVDNQSSVSEDPYSVLGLSRDASSSEIKKQYKNLLSQYHPDKVEHLGEDIKKTAIEKTLAIQVAYQKLKK
jgi:DnaJ like chaperone protein